MLDRPDQARLPEVGTGFGLEVAHVEVGLVVGATQRLPRAPPDLAAGDGPAAGLGGN